MILTLLRFEPAVCLSESLNKKTQIPDIVSSGLAWLGEEPGGGWVGALGGGVAEARPDPAI